jgi:hypothetical protein
MSDPPIELRTRWRRSSPARAFLLQSRDLISGKAFYSLLQFCYKLTDAKGQVRTEARPCQFENAG